jgi:hypothetical protein
MKSFYFFKDARRLQPLACLLLGVVVFLGGCQTEKPSLSKEAQALKKEMLQEMDKLMERVVEPVSKKDWKALRPILKTSYEEMKQGGKLVPTRIMVMDRKGISRSIYPPIEKARWDFSAYDHIREAYDNKTNVVFEGFLRGGGTIWIFCTFSSKWESNRWFVNGILSQRYRRKMEDIGRGISEYRFSLNNKPDASLT